MMGSAQGSVLPVVSLDAMKLQKKKKKTSPGQHQEHDWVSPAEPKQFYATH